MNTEVSTPQAVAMEERPASGGRQGSATPAAPGQQASTTATTSPSAPAEEPAKPVTAKSSRRAHAHPSSAHVLLLLILTYLLAHVGILVQQARLWLKDLLAGQALVPSTLLRMVLVLHELATVYFGSFFVKATSYRVNETEIAERAFLQCAIIIPVFQCLYIAVNPASWDGERRWWGFQASMSLISVLCCFKPSHSILHAISAGGLVTLVHCCGSCLSGNCSITAWKLIHCFITQGFLIQLAGAVAWAASYPVMRKSMIRRRAAMQPSAAPIPEQPTGDTLSKRSSHDTPATEPQQPAKTGSRRASFNLVPGPGVSPNASREQGRPEPGSQQASVLRQRRHQPADVGSCQGAAGKAQSSSSTTKQQQQQQQQGQQGQQGQQAQGQQQGQHQSGSEEEPEILPLEYFGIYIFRVLGLAPTIRKLDAYVNSLADRVDEGLVVRLVCLPVAMHSLAYAIMARLRFLNFDYGCISYDMLFMWMGAWFMLGRDSVTFDMDKALSQVQEQLAASLRALSKPRQQTVTELVDSVRQQMVGSDCTPSATHDSLSGEDVQLLEPLGEGTFGKVYKGIWRGTIVAIKSMVLPRNERRERMAIMEAAISAALLHPNVLQTYAYSLQPVRDGSVVCSRRSVQLMEEAQGSGAETGSEGDHSLAGGGTTRGFEVRLVTEFMDLGTLRDALDRRAFFLLPSLEVDYCSVLDTATDIAKGIQHLHSLNIIHGDLKARNVLLKSCASDRRGFTAKISDFGLSHKMGAGETHVSKLFQGTPSHMAPEVFLHGNQSKGADAYSFGVTMWELYTGEHAFQGTSPAMLPHHVTDLGERPLFQTDTPRGYAHLAQRCWDADVHARPSFAEVVSTLAILRAQAGSQKPFASIAERLQAMAAADQKSLSRELPSAIVLGHQDTKTSTWYQF